jgi:FkbM family methyltransferase
MGTHLLATVFRWSRPLAHYLGPLLPAARRTFHAALRMRYSDGALMTAMQNGREWRLAPDVALRGAFQEFATIEWFRSCVRPGMTVIDVGANVGQMTLELAVLVGAAGKVLSIEPGRGNLALLHRHVRGNGMQDRVEIVEAACAEAHGGEVEFYVAGDSLTSVGSGHSLAGADAIQRAAPGVAVHVARCAKVSIDGLCAERGLTPSMIKIDVEGGELMVLAGAKQTLAIARPLVLVGFHPFAFADALAASDELRRLLGEVGYRLEDAPRTGPFELREYVAVPRIDWNAHDQ